MGILAVVTEVFAVLSVLLVATLWAVVGTEQLRVAVGDVSARLRMAVGPVGVLAAVLAVNSIVRDVGVSVSWIIGLNITDEIYAIEGAVVGALQSAVPTWLIYYFGYVYVYGYVFLLIFPLLAALATARRRLLRRTAFAYTINYAVGMTCYLLFVAYGPRNTVTVVEPLLFDLLPRFQLLTSEVNANTNVFPSLHTSLSATAALLAVDAHETFPRWTPIAVFLATSIVLSTMVLGIHWVTDVAAGLVLAAGSVWLVRSPRVRSLRRSITGRVRG
jgi:membrane-associated phospholipid phosphatase